MAIPMLMVPRSSWCLAVVYVEDVKAMMGAGVVGVAAASNASCQVVQLCADWDFVQHKLPQETPSSA